jgi:hypothetical protein
VLSCIIFASLLHACLALHVIEQVNERKLVCVCVVCVERLR